MLEKKDALETSEHPRPLQQRALPIGQSSYAEIDAWYLGRGLRGPAHDLYPFIGAIVPGVAAGFLYRTDSSICLLDGYITNLKASPQERNEGLEAVTEFLLMRAIEHGRTNVLIATSDPSIIKRAEEWGFSNKVSKVLMGKEI